MPLCASLFEIWRLGGIDALADITAAITRIVTDHPNNRLDALMPGAYGLAPETWGKETENWQGTGASEVV